MNIVTKNISKNSYIESEDYITYRVINERFICSIVSDGNGSVGLRSPIGEYPFENMIHKRATFVSFSTYQYSLIIINKVCEYLLNLPVHDSISFKPLKKIYGQINYMLLKDIRDDICFCSLLTIIDRQNNRLYYCSIGDCSFSVVNLNTNRIKSKIQQKVRKITYQGNALVRIPESLTNSISDPIIIDMGTIKLPKSYIFLLYSDGIDYDYRFPLSLAGTQHNITENKYLNNKLDKLIKENNSIYYTVAIKKDEILRICLDKNNNVSQIMNKILDIVENNIKENKCKKDDISILIFKND